MRDKLGICQWFHYEAFDDLDRAVALMEELGVRHLRTGVSWADFHRPGGRAFYDRQMKTLRDAGLEVLLSVWHTPPSLSENGACNGPPRRLLDYSDFVGQLIETWGDCFAAVELWNEPNNRYKWDFEQCDPGWAKLGEMLRHAAFWTRRHGKPAVLGGMIPVDPCWLELMRSYGTLDHVDVVAIHAFPGMWWQDAPNWDWHSHWGGWDDKIATLPVERLWVTETGLATWNLDTGRTDHHAAQVARLEEAARAPAERVYWYCLVDLHPDREAIEGFHVDENEYHLGLVTSDGEKKPAWYRFQELLGEEAAGDSQSAAS